MVLVGKDNNTIKLKGLDYGSWLVAESQGCTPWAASSSLRKNIWAWPSKIKALRTLWVALEAGDLKSLWMYPVFSLENTEVLRSCLKCQNTECWWHKHPDNPVRALLTQGCAGLLSPASQPSLRCHLLLFQLESVDLNHITPEVRLWSSSHHREAQLALKVKLHPPEEGNRDKSEGPEVSPHIQDISWLQEQGWMCSILLWKG